MGNFPGKIFQEFSLDLKLEKEPKYDDQFRFGGRFWGVVGVVDCVTALPIDSKHSCNGYVA